MAGAVWLRPRSSDRAALQFLYLDHHLPPAELAGPVKQIAVFGANIGLLLGDLAARYPGPRLLGAEPNRDNATVARRNLTHLCDRCSLLETAVWYRNERLTLSWVSDAWGYALINRPQNGGGRTMQVDAVDAGKLLSEFSGPAPVDYLLVNIESAWYEMLRHGEWTGNVRCIKIEISDHYDEAVPLLEALGYQARLERLYWGAFAIGIRR
jgi:FkbM family methyltransferase